MSSRPLPRPLLPNQRTTPTSPLASDRNSNMLPQPLAFLSEDPSPPSALIQKEGGARLKVKSATTPEAKTRLLKSFARTPAAQVLMPSFDSPAGVRSRESTIRLVPQASAIPPSDSWDSLDGWAKEERIDALGEEEMGQTEAVSIAVRVRPPNATEMRSALDASVWDCPSWDEHVIKLPKGREGAPTDREWIFDRILPPHSDNAQAYATSARAHVRSAMEGFNAVIFAYGQTASGKTFTLTGSPSNPGIIPLSIADVFALIRHTPDREFLLRASYLELYNESIIDLLSAEHKELTLSEGKKKGEVVINGLTECAVRTEEDVRGLLRVGEDNRKVGQTDWNARSSRSHCVFRITIESRARGPNDEISLTARTPGGRLKAAGEKMTRISTLSIIDLAGSEKHTSSKERNVEGRHINQSLLTLKLVISKLADMASKRNVTHVPYRDSKLTRLLQPSLSGDALISVICTVSPSAINLSESLSTLSFAQGLKRVVLRAQKKEVIDPQALIQQYQNEIAELRALLREKDETPSGSGRGMVRERRRSKGDKANDQALEKRLEELKSMILTSVTVGSESAPGQRPGEARPLSLTKLKYPKLDFDKGTTELQEDLHAAELRSADLEDEISRLKRELDTRPLVPDSRVLELQDEVAGLRMIAADYDRHLLEPSRKVREDVEKEWKGRMQRLEAQLESKRIWANRLDENLRAVSAENKVLAAQKAEAESKVLQIIEWVNAALDPNSATDSGASGTLPDTGIPTLVVSQDLYTDDDFGPSLVSGFGRKGGSVNKQATLTLSAKMARGMSTMDLQTLSERFGSLSAGGPGGGARGRGMRMLREESGLDLARELEDEY